MKKPFRFPALVLAVCMLLSLSAFASGEPSAPPGGGSSEPESYDAVLDITSDMTLDGVAMSSEAGDQNVIHVYGGASALVANSTFKNGGTGSSGDASSFYGVGATLFVSDGSLYVNNVSIDSQTAGGAGVFAYDGGTAYVSNAQITTTEGSAGGLHVAGGGTLYAWDCDVVTKAGMAAAAIRSDRGGGTMVIDGGSYITEGGTGAVYTTADISVHNAYLYAGGSEAVAIEGKNRLRLFDCSLEGRMLPGAINDNKVWNILVYQSMSGDAELGTSEFDMIGGRLTAHAGPVVYNTNTSSYITFKDVDIVRSSDTTYLLQVTGNSSSRTWGSLGKNGANCVFSAYSQELPGDVVYDSISNLDLYLLEGSALTGAILYDDSLNGGYTGSGLMNLTISEGSVWNVTGTSVITGTLACAGAVTNATIMDFSGRVLWGSGPNAVYVGALTGTADAGAAGAVPVWEDYAAANPFGAAAAAPAGYTADYAGWIRYLKDYVAAVPAAREHLDEFCAGIDAGEFYTFPVDMLFVDTYWGYTAATYDEFIAAGGQVTIPDFDPGLAADAGP